jgi:hypothetical protein
MIDWLIEWIYWICIAPVSSKCSLTCALQTLRAILLGKKDGSLAVFFKMFRLGTVCVLSGNLFQSVTAETLNRRSPYRVRALRTTREKVPADLRYCLWDETALGEMALGEMALGEIVTMQCNGRALFTVVRPLLLQLAYCSARISTVPCVLLV